MNQFLLAYWQSPNNRVRYTEASKNCNTLGCSSYRLFLIYTHRKSLKSWPLSIWGNETWEGEPCFNDLSCILEKFTESSCISMEVLVGKDLDVAFH